MTSPTALDQTASGNGGVATRPQRRDGSLTRWTRPRARGPAPTSGRTAVTCPDPSPADAAPLASASLLASLPPEVGRLSLSGYGSPSGAGGRTGEPGGGGGCGGGGSGGGNGGAGAGAERSGGDEGRGLRGRPAPCPAGTGAASWREHWSPRRGRVGPDGEEGGPAWGQEVAWVDASPGFSRSLGLLQPGGAEG